MEKWLLHFIPYVYVLHQYHYYVLIAYLVPVPLYQDNTNWLNTFSKHRNLEGSILAESINYHCSRGMGSIIRCCSCCHFSYMHSQLFCFVPFHHCFCHFPIHCSMNGKNAKNRKPLNRNKRGKNAVCCCYLFSWYFMCWLRHYACVCWCVFVCVCCV